jgi:type IV pilus assembly protein PilO
MALNIRELSLPVNMLLAVAVAALVFGLGWYVPGSPLVTQRTDLTDANAEKDRLTDEVAKLQVYKRQHAQLQADIAALQKQMETLRTIVPEEKEVDEFIRMLHAQASGSGVEIRRLTAKPVVAREFYNELPFEVEFDGPYYGVMGFFGKLGRLSRIINVGDLGFMSAERTRQDKGRPKYPIRAGTTVIATCTATTFFTKAEELPPQPGKAAGKQPGRQAPGKQPGAR